MVYYRKDKNMRENYRDKEFITVEQLAEVMNISKSYAYMFMKREDLPFTYLQLGRRMIIPTNSFYSWYDSLANEAKGE